MYIFLKFVYCKSPINYTSYLTFWLEISLVVGILYIFKWTNPYHQLFETFINVREKNLYNEQFVFNFFSVISALEG